MHPLRLAFAAALIGLATPPARPQDVELGSSPQDFLVRARQEIDYKQFSAAQADIDQAIAADPNSRDAYFMLASLRAEMGNLDGAIGAMSKVIDLNSEPAAMPYFVLRRGYLKQQLGDDVGAEADYSEAIRLKPDFGYAFKQRGFLRLEMDERAAGKADVNRGDDLLNQAASTVDRYQGLLIRPEANSPAYFIELAREQHLLGVDSDAITTFAKAIELDRGYAPFYYIRSQIYFEDGDFSSALSDARQAEELFGTGAQSEMVADYRDYNQLRIFLCLARKDHSDEARTTLRAYLHDRPTPPGFDWRGHLIRFLLGDLAEKDLFAAASDGSARTEAAHECEACFYAGEMHLLAGDKSGAGTLFLKCLHTRCYSFTEYASAKAELRGLGVKTD
jgi:lipoprotein NlpI